MEDPPPPVEGVEGGREGGDTIGGGLLGREPGSYIYIYIYIYQDPQPNPERYLFWKKVPFLVPGQELLY